MILKNIKKKVQDMDKIVLFICLFLIVFGTLNIVTASSREAVINLEQSVYYYFYRHAIILVISIIGFLILINIHSKNYGKFAIWIFLLVLILNLFLIFKGATTRGAQNWIDLNFFKLQPSEIAKPTLIVCISLLFEKYHKKLKDPNNKHDIMIWKIILIGLIFPLIVFFQKDLGTAMILFGIFAFLFFSSPISKKEKAQISIIVIVIGIVLAFCILSITGYLLSSAQMSRFDFFNPCSKYTTTGYQVCNAFIAINNGGLTGVGLGNSTQKYSYIPEPHTDMVFSIIAEENGMIVCGLIYKNLTIRILKLLFLKNNLLI